MFRKIFLAGMILAIVISAMALAEGGFHGTISYHECNCSSWDKVKITNLSTQEVDYYNVDCGNPDSYTTAHTTYPEGWYQLVVIPEEESDCDHGIVVRVFHPDTTDNQTVNLAVYGPQGQPDSGGDEGNE
jgi:hypothetical protein